MQRSEFKKQIIERCIIEVKKSIELSENEMKEAQQNANEYGGPKDRYDPYRNQQMNKKDMYGKQLAKSINELNALEIIDPEEVLEEVTFGAIVITDTQKLFISVGLGKIEIGNDTIYAISVNSPICQAMMGKKTNDDFLCNGRKFIIKEIY